MQESIIKTMIVAKIESLSKSSMRFGKQKVYLWDRLFHAGEHKFLSDVIDGIALTGPRAWEFEVGDVVRCRFQGSQSRDGKNETNLWLPIDLQPKIHNVVLTESVEMVDGLPCRVGSDGSLVYCDTEASVARPGQEWACNVIKVSEDDRLIWYPWEMIKHWQADPVKRDGKIVFTIRGVSGSVNITTPEEVEPEVEEDVIEEDDKHKVVRERYHYPISHFNGEEPVFSGYVEREIIYKKGKKNESALFRDSFGSVAHFGGAGIPQVVSRAPEDQEGEGD